MLAYPAVCARLSAPACKRTSGTPTAKPADTAPKPVPAAARTELLQVLQALQFEEIAPTFGELGTAKAGNGKDEL